MESCKAIIVLLDNNGEASTTIEIKNTFTGFFNIIVPAWDFKSIKRELYDLNLKIAPFTKTGESNIIIHDIHRLDSEKKKKDYLERELKLLNKVIKRWWL